MKSGSNLWIMSGAGHLQKNILHASAITFTLKLPIQLICDVLLFLHVKPNVLLLKTWNWHAKKHVFTWIIQRLSHAVLTVGHFCTGRTLCGTATCSFSSNVIRFCDPDCNFKGQRGSSIKEGNSDRVREQLQQYVLYWISLRNSLTRRGGKIRFHRQIGCLSQCLRWRQQKQKSRNFSGSSCGVVLLLFSFYPVITSALSEEECENGEWKQHLKNTHVD